MKKKLTKSKIRIKLLDKYDVKPEDLNPIKIKEFKEKCKTLSDVRIKKKCSYKLWDVVVVVFLGVLAKCDEWDEIRNKIKSLNVLNVYSNNYKMCIASEMIDEKTNEITAMPDLINRININGSIATWDALNTQTEITKTVIHNKGDYVAALKKNQGNFYEDVILYFNDDMLDIIRAKDYGYLIHHEKSHSKLITYEYFQTEDINWYFDRSSWAGLKSIGMVRKKITSYDVKEKKEITSTECRYYISSLNTNIKLFSEAVRTHWSVENKLHWHLDYTFNQDNNSTVNKMALNNLQLIKKFSLALLSDAQEIYDYSLNNIRFLLSLDFENEILRLFNILSRRN